VAVFQELGIDYCPCLLDVFIAAVRYVEGAPKKPWGKYTAERKRVMAAREKRNQ